MHLWTTHLNDPSDFSPGSLGEEIAGYLNGNPVGDALSKSFDDLINQNIKYKNSIEHAASLKDLYGTDRVKHLLTDDDGYSIHEHNDTDGETYHFITKAI